MILVIVPRRFRLLFVFVYVSIAFALFSTLNWIYSFTPSTTSSSSEISPAEVAAVYQPQPWYHRRMTETEEFPLSHYENISKKILFWTDDASDGARYYAIGGLGADIFRRNGCPVWQCEAYDYLNLNTSGIPVEEFDAVMFHDPNSEEREMPLKRSPHQRYVFWTQESPAHQRRIKRWNSLAGFFNWTMTYRWDSDVVYPYGWFSRIDSPSRIVRDQSLTGTSSRHNFAKGKSKLVAGFISHCYAENGRNEYVKHLKQFIDVDIYGECGLPCCSKSEEDENPSCRRDILLPYKFELSFENSLCLDYVSQRFYRTMMNHDIISIVLDAHGNHAKFAPPHSYINALDFPSVRHLADYLIELDRNDTLYNQYFWWKEYYTIQAASQYFKRGLCRLCSLLHEPKSSTTVYEDLTGWWASQGNCKTLEFVKSVDNSSDASTWITVPVD